MTDVRSLNRRLASTAGRVAVGLCVLAVAGLAAWLSRREPTDGATAGGAGRGGGEPRSVADVDAAAAPRRIASNAFEAPEPADAVRRFEVVYDGSTAGVPGATVVVFDALDKIAAMIGTTGADGRLVAACVPLPPGSWFGATADGYEVGRAAAALADAEPCAAVRIPLQAGAEIEGGVAFDDGIAPATPLRMLAWPTTLGDPDAAAVVGDRLPAAVRETRTDANGRFRFRGLSRGTDYRLVGGALGVGVGGRPVPAGTSGVELKAFRFYSTVLRLRDGAGPPPTSPTMVSSSSYLSFRPESVGAHSVGDWSPTLVLAGADPRLIRTAQIGRKRPTILAGAASRADASDPLWTAIEDDYVFSWFVTKSSGVDRIDGIPFESRPPGYEPLRTEVSAFWIGDGYRVQDLALTRKCDGYGRFVLSVRDLPAVVSKAVRPSDICGRVTFFNRETQDAFDTFLPLGGGSFVMPAGTYVIMADASGLAVRWTGGARELEVRVPVDGEAAGALDASPWALLTLDIRSADGVPLRTGPTDLVTLSALSAAVGPYSIGMSFFGEPRHVIVPAPGSYEFDFYFRRAGAPTAARLQEREFAIRAGGSYALTGVVD